LAIPPPTDDPLPGINPLGLSFLGVETGGKSYLLPFEIVSIHLLVVLVAAAYLARAKRRVRDQAPPRVPPRNGQETGGWGLQKPEVAP
jgi:hypothetical protein